jgi:hypothetical protein
VGVAGLGATALFVPLAECQERQAALRLEEGRVEGAHINLIKENVEYCLENNFHVILEGIFHLKLYKDLLNYLNQKFPNNIFFYFDI